MDDDTVGPITFNPVKANLWVHQFCVFTV